MNLGPFSENRGSNDCEKVSLCLSRLLTFTRYIQATPVLGGVGVGKKHFEEILIYTVPR